MTGFPHSRPAFIGRYRIDSLLGKGGMGEVYKAYDPSLDRTVALKTIAPDADNPVFLDRLYREAKACGRLHHPNIVTVHDLGEIDGIVFIAMEYMQGEDLAAALKRGEFTFEEKIQVLMQVLDALQYAHSEGVIHRDIKPSNVYVLPNKTIKLLDFGLARVARADSLTMSGAVMGTPYYMSPEQLKGQKVDGRTDVYAVGVVAYEMLTRRRVFDGDNITTVMLKVLSDPPAPMATMWSTTFPEIERIVFRALAKNADERYATAEDMKNALSAFLSSSRSKVVTTQADMTVYAQRAVIDAKTLIAEGRIEDAQTLLTQTLVKNPDAEDARRLLDAQTQPLAPLEAPEAAPEPAVAGGGFAAPTLVNKTVVNPAAASAPTAAVGQPAVARTQVATRAVAPPLPPAGESTSVSAATVPPVESPYRRLWMLSGAAAAVVAIAVVGFNTYRSVPSTGNAGPDAGQIASAPSAPPAVDSAAAPAAPAPSGNSAPLESLPTASGNAPATAVNGRSSTPGTNANASATPPAAGGDKLAANTSGRSNAPAASAVSAGGRGAAPSQPGATPASNNSAGAAAAAARPAPTAKALFGGEDNAGLKYAIVQQKDGKEIDVDSSTTFHSGDKVRFNFETNIDGYLYVVTEGSSGRWTVLFPNPAINGGKNAVKRYERYPVPATSWFVFDNTPGSENIFVFLSKTPMEQLPGFKAPVTKTETVAQSVVDDLKSRVRARDLILDKDTTDVPIGGIAAPVTYVVNRDEVGQAVTATIQLNHAQ